MPKKSPKVQAQEFSDMYEQARAAEATELKERDEQRRARIEEENRKREEARVAREDELARLKDQAAKDEQLLLERQAAITRLENKVKAEREWEKFLECNPLPDVAQESELNTYKSMWEAPEDPPLAPHEGLEPTLQGCYTTESVIHLLDSEIGDAVERNDTEKMEWLDGYVRSLRDTTRGKLDLLTSKFILRADEYEEMGTSVMTKCYTTPYVNYGLWVQNDVRKQEGGGRGVRTIHFQEINFTIELPMSIRQTRTCLRVVQTEYDHVSDSSQSSRVSVGGIVDIQQLKLPEAPKELKGWIMRELTPHTFQVQVVPYPPKTNNETIESFADVASLYVQYKIPDTVYLRGRSPTVGWWDSTKQAWRTDGISGVKLDAKQHTISMQLSVLEPFAIIQPRALDFPYRAWSTTPKGQDRVIFAVSGSRFDVEFECKGGMVRLQQPVEPVLAELNENYFMPGELLMRLRKAGINLIPTDADAEFCRKPIKDKTIEQKMHEQLSRVAGVFELSGSPWNSSRHEEQILLMVREVGTAEQLAKAPQGAPLQASVAEQDAQHAAETPEGEENSSTVANDAAGDKGEGSSNNNNNDGGDGGDNSESKEEEKTEDASSGDKGEDGDGAGGGDG